MGNFNTQPVLMGLYEKRQEALRHVELLLANIRRDKVLYTTDGRYGEFQARITRLEQQRDTILDNLEQYETILNLQ